MQEWTNQHDVAKVDIARVDNAAPCGRGGQGRSGVQKVKQYSKKF